MAYEDYHVNADDVKLDGDPNIRRTVPPSPSSSTFALISMEIDSNGDLWAVLVDGSNPNIFYYDEVNGDLYYDL